MHQFLALTSPGIEVLLADEIKSLGGENVTQKPEGVYFSGTLAQGYHVSLWTRMATRVMLKLGEGKSYNKEALYFDCFCLLRKSIQSVWVLGNKALLYECKQGFPVNGGFRL